MLATTITASTYEDWKNEGRLYDWRIKPSPKWLRLPVIRHVRAAWHKFNIVAHEGLYFQLGMYPTGYDRWVLYGRVRGWC